MSNQTIEIAKIGQTREVDFGALPEASQNFIINYGLRQVLNDAHSQCVGIRRDGGLPFGDLSEKKNLEAFTKAVNEAIDEKLAALASGQITIRKAGTPKIVDPVEREAYRLARDVVTSAVKAKGHTIKAVENFNDLVANHLEANKESFMKTAKKNIDAMANAPQVDIDLSTLTVKK